MPGVAILSHGIGAAAFLVIAVILSLHQPTRSKAPWVIVACLCTSIWSLFASLYAYKIIPNYQWVVLSEVVQDGSWCFAILRMLATHKAKRGISQQSYLTIALGLGLLIMVTNAWLIHQQWVPGKHSLFVEIDFIGHLALSVFGLSLLEQLYRGVKPHRRWGIKYFCISIGALFCYDFFMYAHALMFKGLDPSLWYTRGGINLFIAPLILFSALRDSRWHSDLAPSRVLVYRSTVIVSCGIYLVVMASLGYVLRAVGGHWGKALSILFVFGAGVLLFTLLFSGKARAHIKLVLARHVFRLYYDYREEWIRFSELLGQPSDEYSLGTRVIMAFAAMVESPDGVLFEREDGFKLSDQWNADSNLSNFVLASHVAFFESLQEPCLVENLAKRGEIGEQIFEQLQPYERAWLIVPFKMNQQVQGFVLLGKPRVKVDLNWEIRDLLNTAGSQAAVFLHQKRLLEALQIAKQFESYHQISAFMLHDIKNLLSSTQLILQNKKHAGDPKFIDTLFITMESIHTKLLKMQNQLHAPTDSWSNDIVDVKFELEKITAEYRLRQKQVQFEPPEVVSINTKIDLDSFRHGLKHLIDNGLEACETDMAVTLSLQVQQGQIRIKVSDQGIGMSQKFINDELFKPFVSTKGQKGMGIGVFQVKSLIEKANGKIEVQSSEGNGTTFTLSLPEYQVNSQHRQQNLIEDIT